MALYAGSRLFLVAFRTDTPFLPGGIRTAQVSALATLLGTTWYLYRGHFAVISGPATETTNEVEPR